MSIKNAEAFREQVLADPKLQGEIRAAIQSSDGVQLTGIGGEKGYDFTEAECQAVLQEHANDELSDFELEMVQAASGIHAIDGTKEAQDAGKYI